METREQIMKAILSALPKLSDAHLRMVRGFIKGILKNQG